MKRRVKAIKRIAKTVDAGIKKIAKVIVPVKRRTDLAPQRDGIASTRDPVTTLTDRQVTELAQRCKQAAIEKKADNVVLIDIRGRANFADYFVLATGRSVIQVRAIADAVVEASEIQFGTPVRTEGYNEGSWVLVDYGAVIVHVFTPAAREFYNLERLWAKPTARRKGEK